MRVALVVPVYLPHQGGVQKHVEELATGLLRRGVTVDVLVQEKDRAVPVEATDGRLTIRRFPVPFSLPRYTIAPPLLSYLRRTAASYDVVHAHNYHELVPAFASVSRAENLVLTSHYHAPSDGTVASVLRAPHRLLSRIVITSFDRVICVSAAESTALSLELPGIFARTRVIPNGVDVARIRAVRTHGRRQALRAVRGPARSPQAGGRDHSGGWSGTSRPCRRRRRTGAPDPGESSRPGRHGDPFPGSGGRRRLHRWIRGASVVVTMSDRAAFGLVILEAFAAGVPVVASDIPAHRETVGYGPPTASTLVPVGADPRVLRDSIGQMVTSGPRGFRASVPSWDDMAARTLRLYEELVTRPAG